MILQLSFRWCSIKVDSWFRVITTDPVLNTGHTIGHTNPQAVWISSPTSSPWSWQSYLDITSFCSETLTVGSRMCVTSTSRPWNECSPMKIKIYRAPAPICCFHIRLGDVLSLGGDFVSERRGIHANRTEYTFSDKVIPRPSRHFLCHMGHQAIHQIAVDVSRSELVMRFQVSQFPVTYRKRFVLGKMSIAAKTLTFKQFIWRTWFGDRLFITRIKGCATYIFIKGEITSDFIGIHTRCRMRWISYYFSTPSIQYPACGNESDLFNIFRLKCDFIQSSSLASIRADNCDILIKFKGAFVLMFPYKNCIT